MSKEIKEVTTGISNVAKGLSNYLEQNPISKTDITWTGAVNTLSLAATKLSEKALDFKEAEDIHCKNSLEFFNEGIQMIQVIDKIIRRVTKKALLISQTNKDTFMWAKDVIIEYAKLLDYVSNTEKEPTFDLEKLFPNKDAKELAKEIWTDGKIVSCERFREIMFGYIKSFTKPKGHVESEVITPILFAAVLGPEGKLKKLEKSIKKYSVNLCSYNPVKLDAKCVKEYNPEDNSKYFYIVSRKFEKSGINGLECHTTFCITPECKYIIININNICYCSFHCYYCCLLL